MPQERLQAAPTTYRPELGGARPPSRLHTVQDLNLNPPPPNPARPPIKRALDAEPEEEPSKSARIHAGQHYQANEGKRRRTSDDEPQEPNVRPTMAPPIRQSNIRKARIPSQPPWAKQSLTFCRICTSSQSTVIAPRRLLLVITPLPCSKPQQLIKLISNTPLSSSRTIDLGNNPTTWPNMVPLDLHLRTPPILQHPHTKLHSQSI